MQKGQLLDAVLEQQKAVHKDGWNVATAQRRDVATSPRQREFLLSIIKRQMGMEFKRIGDWESYEPGCGNQSRVTSILEKSPRFVLFFVFDIRTDVLYIAYWYFLIHYVLDLYLGYC